MWWWERENEEWKATGQWAGQLSRMKTYLGGFPEAKPGVQEAKGEKNAF